MFVYIYVEIIEGISGLASTEVIKEPKYKHIMLLNIALPFGLRIRVCAATTCVPSAQQSARTIAAVHWPRSRYNVVTARKRYDIL